MLKNLKDWMTKNVFLLNSDKREILLIRPKNSTQNLLDHNLQLDGCPVPSSTVKHLGVALDSNLSFENHISHVTKTALFHLRNIAKLRNMLKVHCVIFRMIYRHKCNIIYIVPVWLSGRALCQQRKRLWVRFPGNTHTNENV